MEELQAGDPTRIGPYALTARLGAGGMGQVFLGQSPGGRLVAVKIIHPELARDKEFRARFAREVAVVRTVGGFFTVPVVDADTEAVQPWLATGFVDGPSLDGAVAQYGPMPQSSLVAVAAGLAEGLSAIHGAGVVHRDLKPSNVLLALDGLRVIDFGIARAAEHSPVTGTGRLIGTVGFMSPEQAKSGTVGPESDVFSMGGVLAFAASGDDPFGRASTPQLLFRVVYEAPRLDGLRGRLRDLVAWCMDKDPARRPTASQFLAELPPLTHARQSRAAIADWWRAVPEPTLAPRPVAPEPAVPSRPVAVPGPGTVPGPLVSSGDSATGSRVTLPPAPVLAVPGATETARSAPSSTGFGITRPPDLVSPDPVRTLVPPRRRFTRRTIVTSILVVLVLALGGGAFAGWQYVQSQYYIGVASDGTVAIFQGVDSSVLGLSLSSTYQDTSLPLAQLSVPDQTAIRSTIALDSLSTAQRSISDLQVQAADCRNSWDQLVAWQRVDVAYKRDINIWVRLTPNLRAAHPKPAAPPSRPDTPTSGNCGPASAFGITAAQLPAGTPNTRPAGALRSGPGHALRQPGAVAL